jgi:uncharacterized membrane protein YjjP (DUF1212 family)
MSEAAPTSTPANDETSNTGNPVPNTTSIAVQYGYPGTSAIDLPEMNAHVRGVLDLTMRLAEVIFTAGAGAEDATAAMEAITRAYGLKGTEADITHTIITLTHESPATHESIQRRRNVKYRSLNYAKLSATSELIADLIEDPVDLAEARKRLATIISAKPLVPVLYRRLGWALLGAGAAILIGGGLVVVLAAFFATFLIDTISSALEHRQVPIFYQTVVGGAIGPLVALVVQLLYPPATPALVVIATIIVLLAGVTTFGAVHDTLSGFYLTGTARLMEALLITSGLVTGVAGSSMVLARFGLDLQVDGFPGPSFTNLPLLLLAAVVIVVGFSLAVQVPWRAIWAVCVLGALAEFLYLAGFAAGFGLVWSAGASAVGVGLLAALAARLVRTPPLVIVVTALVPLVPGLTLFRGLLQLSDGNINGLLSLLTAAGIAIALAAGAILAQSLAQYVWGPARRLQRRFVGPLMALPVRLGRGPGRRI